jgi:hypothetical protein
MAAAMLVRNCGTHPSASPILTPEALAMAASLAASSSF